MSAARATKSPERARKPEQEAQPFKFSRPCRCRHHSDHSEILAYAEPGEDWEVVAVIRQTGRANPKATAEFICNLINGSQTNKNLLLEAMEALEDCLEGNGLTFSSEQAADSVVTRIKKIVA